MFSNPCFVFVPARKYDQQQSQSDSVQLSMEWSDQRRRSSPTNAADGKKGCADLELTETWIAGE